MLQEFCVSPSEINPCLGGNGGCHINADCVHVGPNKVKNDFIFWRRAFHFSDLFFLLIEIYLNSADFLCLQWRLLRWWTELQDDQLVSESKFDYKLWSIGLIHFHRIIIYLNIKRRNYVELNCNKTVKMEATQVLWKSKKSIITKVLLDHAKVKYYRYNAEYKLRKTIAIVECIKLYYTVDYTQKIWMQKYSRN